MPRITTTFAAKDTDRGTGLICPHDDCEGRFIVNPDRLEESWKHGGSAAFHDMMTCPYCARISKLPEED
jgi:hypothetical protein